MNKENKKILRVAIGQINQTVGDFAGNIVKIKTAIDSAIEKSVDIIAFPELAVCGYPAEDLLFKEHFIKENIKGLKKIVEHTRGITAIVGFVDMDKKGEIYNAAGVLSDRHFYGAYYKMMLPNYSVFDEKRYFNAGEKNSIFILGDFVNGVGVGKKKHATKECVIFANDFLRQESNGEELLSRAEFGVVICEDLWVDNGPYMAQAAGGADIIFNISASPYHAGKSKERVDLARDRARETNAVIVYANLIGGQDELVFDGASFIVDPRGEIIAGGKHFEEDLVIADINLDKFKKAPVVQKKQNTLKRIYIFPALKQEKINLVKKKFIENSNIQQGNVNSLTKKMGNIEEIYRALVLGTKDYVIKNGFKKIILGLSGGIDSALTAVIACEALGKENVIGVTMPSPYSSSETFNDAKKIAQNLEIMFYEVPIETAMNAYKEILAPVFKDGARGIVEENLQARIRGNILMAFSNNYGWLVLTTGNKSETAVGYSTLYGDTAGGFAVIKDVPKTVVYELSNFINKQTNRELIPKTIIKRAPSAELRPNQKDTDSLPEYNILDQILKLYIEEDKSIIDIQKTGAGKTVIKNIINLVDKSEYKRRQSPPGIRITPKSFGKDRRLPITNKYQE
ncbi:NH(3)-dependent NAD(+) synthetase [Candidatus Omnitrophus magneticus]|uniref:Glutamine-dependent NAD(+) synthetase n=2 Tax=Candidatus Omnitrophus magneticus TaxID=1609969 RepID=A0A0F0CQK7_9BACT|nr:NH(3)-dependent NAD(+) synthetase [Candidatus Omnitrophus magneticus]KJJ84794.1 NH(3)-dependent NAD(+) synthetase [Candidatus Omnitrophus magneticus]